MSIIYNNQIVAGKYVEQAIPDSDTINKGIIKIATEEEVLQGTSNNTAITPLYLSKKQDKLIAGDGIIIDENLIECAFVPDEQTIVQNTDGTMSTIGQLTKSGTIKIDWEGTEAEYTQAMLDGTIQPDWYCYITDDEAFVDYADVANQDLSNLRPAGEARFDEKLGKTEITDCLLKVPYNIKYDLTDGIFTLKAGSIIIIPYGIIDLTPEYPVGSVFINNNFKVVDAKYSDGKFFVWAEIQNDIKVSGSTTDTTIRNLYVNLSNNSAFLHMNNTSSNIQYVGTGNNSNYRTDLNIIENTTSGTLSTAKISLPLMRISANGANLCGSVEQVFNGMGYIGSTVFVDKGVKCLIPNGRNADGTLNNREEVTPSIFTVTDTGTRSNWSLVLNKDGLYILSQFNTVDGSQPTTSGPCYTIETNKVYNNGQQRYWVHLANFSNTSGVFTNIDFKLPFRAVDYNDYKKEVDTLNAELDTKVNKAGDIMTGNLTINKKNGCYHIKSTSLDATKVISETEISAYRQLDTNNIILGDIRFERNANGTQYTRLLARNKITGSEISGYLSVAVDKNGSAFTVAPTPATNDNSTKIATTAYVNNKINATVNSEIIPVIEAYVDGVTGYRLYSDGYCEQWGQAGTGTSYVGRYLKDFIDTNYNFVAVDHESTSSDADGVDYAVMVSDLTRTGFRMSKASSRTCYWRACGYIS